MHEPPTAALLTFARDVITEAAALAHRHAGKVSAHLKADRSLVTDVDLAVQAHVRERVLAAFPEHGFLGEEGHADGARDASHLWILDPIDGTDAFWRGLPGWAVSLGLLVGDAPALAVVAVPATGELYWATAGGGAFLDGALIEVAPGSDLGRGTLTLVPSSLHQVARPTTDGRIQAYGSASFHLACVARGSAHAAVLGASKVWDWFAGSILLEAAGGALHSIHGERLDLGSLARARHGLTGAIACHPDRIGAVLGAFDVDLPRELHGFTGVMRRGAF